jgi:hypothetical protein
MAAYWGMEAFGSDGNTRYTYYNVNNELYINNVKLNLTYAFDTFAL